MRFEQECAVADLCREAGDLLKSGELFAARDLIEEAVAHLSEAVVDLHGQVWYLQALTYLHIGDWSMSIQALQRFLWHTDRYPALAGLLLGPVHYHLGVAYRSRSEKVLAMVHFHQAINLLRAEGYSDLLRQALHEAAWLACQDENVDGAHSLLDEAETLAMAPGARAYQRGYRAYAYLLQGEVMPALDLLEEVIRELDWTDDSVAAGLGMCHYVMGLLMLRSGEVEGALQFAEAANLLAARANNVTLMNLACSLRAAVMDRNANELCAAS